MKRLAACFEGRCAEGGRPSRPPAKLLRALVLQCRYSVRRERLWMEPLAYHLLFRWFVGLPMDDPIWDFPVFSKNRERRLEAEVARAFFVEIGRLAREPGRLSDEHFPVDGTLLEAWAGQKSFKPRAGTPPPTASDAGNPSVNFRGQKRPNDTQASTTDPDARLYKKAPGQEAKLAFLGHVRMANRNGLVVQPRLTKAPGTAAREASGARARAPRQAKRGPLTLGGDKNYDPRAPVATLRGWKVTPQVAQHTARPGGRASDQRTTRPGGCAASQTKRKRVEAIFGWFKTVALLRKPRFRGLQRGGGRFTWAAAAYNLVRMRKLLGATP